MSSPLSLLTILAILLAPTLTESTILDLGTTSKGTWTVYSPDKGSKVTTPVPTHRVPGDVYADLQSAGIIKNPLYGKRDEEYRWVGRSAWTYARDFLLSDEVGKCYSRNRTSENEEAELGVT